MTSNNDLSFLNQPIVASAPPMATMDNVMGVTVGSYHEESISEDELQEKLLELVSQEKCYGKGAAKKMDVNEVKAFSSFNCVWETFTEKRSAGWLSCAYNGDIIDPPTNGVTPSMWEIPTPEFEMFEDSCVNVKVPHTDYVRQCVACLGRCIGVCITCGGRGLVKCPYCNGVGSTVSHSTSSNGHRHSHRTTCGMCHGTGCIACDVCDSKGVVPCSRCHGSGQQLHYVNMKVEFINHSYNVILDNSGIFEDCILESDGETLCQQQGYRLLPPQSAPDSSICTACSTLFNKAEAIINSNTERLIQQRVTVSHIPITKASCNYKGTEFITWLFDVDKSCYCPDYPQQVCWGCETY